MNDEANIHKTRRPERKSREESQEYNKVKLS